MHKRMIGYLSSYCETARRQNEYFTKIGDIQTAMYWKGLWVGYQTVLRELDKGKDGFRKWKPKQ